MLLDTFLVLTEEIEQNTYFKKDKFPNEQQYKGNAEKNPLMWGFTDFCFFCVQNNSNHIQTEC